MAMLLTFTHASKFDVEELEKRNSVIDTQIYGEAFVLVHNGSYLEFRMNLYPNCVIGCKGTKYEGVIFGLESRNDKELKISFKQTILLPDGSSHLIDNASDQKFKGHCGNLAPNKPIASKLSELKSKGLLMDNKSTLCIAVEIKVDESYFDIGKELEKKISEMGYGGILFWQNIYANMMGGDDSTDYELVCQGTQHTFPIHKIIARERSPYFKNLFNSHANFKQEKSHLVGWSPAVTEEVRYFLYNDKASTKFSAVPLEDLAQVAGMLELKKLLAICEESFMARICEANAWSYLNIAKTLKMKHLENKALCTVTEDLKLMEKLFDDQKGKELRKEVGEFALKRGRAQLLVQ